jgi:protein involved in plasmid replication-relaxation
MTGNRERGLVLQDRDRHLLKELAVTRVMDREQVKCVAGFRSTTRANCRLLTLTRNGLLRRFFLGTSAGGKKALYALSPTGAKVADVPYRGPRRGRDEILVADFFVTHQLQINQIYCTLKYKPISFPGAQFQRWLSFQEPIEATGSLIPDGYVELRVPDKTIATFLEVDLGHESRSVWQTKVKAYLHLALSGAFEKVFHQPQFRVLTVTNSERRMASLQNCTALLTEKIFWFSTIDSINRDGFWSPVWVRPTEDRRQSLL